MNARLSSRASTPSLLAPFLGDQRRLGIAVKRISMRRATDVADVREYPADHPGLLDGWFEAERDANTIWRWTNGNASLPITANEDPLILEIYAEGHDYVLETVPPTRRTAA